MYIYLYKNKSDNNVVNKSLLNGLQLTGTLRTGTSIINPIVEISYSSTSYFEYNYLRIPDFGNRHYFITNIEVISNKLMVLYCKVDVLRTYKTDILTLNAFVTRNANTYNNLIKDDLVSYYYDKDITEEVPSKGTLVNTTFKTDSSLARNFMLTCISFNTIPINYSVDAPTGSNLPSIEQVKFNEQFGSTSYILHNFQAEYVTYKALKNQQSIGSYIKSLIAYPYELTPNQNDPNNFPIVYVGNEAIKDVTDTNYLYAPYSKYRFSEYLIIADFTMGASTSFLDYEPYTQYELFVPYCTWIQLDANNILGKRIIVYYSVSYDDGSANAYVYNVTDSKLLFTSTCQLGVKIGISTTNNEELSASRKANNLNLTLGLVSSALSVGIGAVGGNPVAVVGGVMGGASSVVSYVNNNSMMFNKAQASYSTGASGMYSSQNVILRTTKMKPRSYNSAYFSLYGKPLNEYKNLSTLTGFTQIGEVHLDSINATKNELDELRILLKEGIIL